MGHKFCECRQSLFCACCWCIIAVNIIFTSYLLVVGKWIPAFLPLAAASCCGTLKYSICAHRRVLALVFTILLLVFSTLVMGVMLGEVLRVNDIVETFSISNLNKKFDHFDEPFFTYIQKKFRCCGVYGKFDYDNKTTKSRDLYGCCTLVDEKTGNCINYHLPGCAGIYKYDRAFHIVIIACLGIHTFTYLVAGCISLLMLCCYSDKWMD